jgi:hypothetical protein
MRKRSHHPSTKREKWKEEGEGEKKEEERKGGGKEEGKGDVSIFLSDDERMEI